MKGQDRDIIRETNMSEIIEIDTVKTGTDLKDWGGKNNKIPNKQATDMTVTIKWNITLPVNQLESYP